MHAEFAMTPLGPIEYTQRGQGAAVLLLHGTSQDCRDELLGAGLPEAEFRLLQPSRPGYGRTPLSVGQTAEQAAEAMAALLDAVGVAEASLLAVSGGGPTGLLLAARHPERVRKLVLMSAICHTAGRQQEAMFEQQARFYGPSHDMQWRLLGVFSRLFPRAMAKQTLRLFSTHDPEDALRRLTPAEIAALSRFYRKPPYRHGALSDLYHSVPVEALASIRVPTLIVHSREDRSVPFAHAEYAHTHIPQAELYAAPSWSHWVTLGPGADEVKRRVAEFLRGDVQA